ncbi:FAD:protein FMN transferase [Patescibacteria group bacterium]|nr:FAD:protein FMN transferase [Patescibacteria group bacterium]
MTKFEFQAIGTGWQIDIAKELSSEEEALLLLEIMDRIKLFDIAYSRFRKDSLVTLMSENSGEFVLPEDANLMISNYKKMYDVTNGLVTPLIGQVLVDAGYDADYSLIEKDLTKPSSWEEAIEWQEPKLIMKTPSLLDFGAGGKGYLVDIISEILEKNKIFSYCVDGSGDLRQRSEVGAILKVGLEHPDDSTQVVGVANILNQSICGSAGNRRKWGNFHHIINPESLTSPKGILAIWAVAETTFLADLLTTALFFVSPEILLKHYIFEYFIIYSDYSMKKSVGFDAEVFT